MYRFLDHTADIKIVGEGKTFEDALQSVIDAVVSLISNSDSHLNITKEFHFEGKFKEDMIIGLLEDILFRVDSLKIVPKKVKLKNINLSKFSVDYIIIGSKGVPNNIIKAATFHQLMIERNGKWRIEVVLDV